MTFRNHLTLPVKVMYENAGVLLSSPRHVGYKFTVLPRLQCKLLWEAAVKAFQAGDGKSGGSRACMHCGGVGWRHRAICRCIWRPRWHQGHHARLTLLPHSISGEAEEAPVVLGCVRCDEDTGRDAIDPHVLVRHFLFRSICSLPGPRPPDVLCGLGLHSALDGRCGASGRPLGPLPPRPGTHWSIWGSRRRVMITGNLRHCFIAVVVTPVLLLLQIYPFKA